MTRISTAFLAASLCWVAAVQVAAPAHAERAYALQAAGAWTLVTPAAGKGRPLLVATVPDRPNVRAACAAEFLGAPLADLGYSKSESDAAVRIMTGPDFACMVRFCALPGTPANFLIWANAARHDGSVESEPGRLTLYARVLPGGEEQPVFKNAGAKDSSADGALTLVQYSISTASDASRATMLRIILAASPAFFGKLEGGATLRLRIPPGRDAQGVAELDVPHAGRPALDFGLAGSRASFAQHAKACGDAERATSR